MHFVPTEAHANARVKIETTGAQDKNDLDLIVGSSDVIFYSALNLLYGAKTSPAAATHISSRRYEVARLSLQSHLKSVAKLSFGDIPKWRIYSDWSAIVQALIDNY
jgi:hypothetical protein